MSPPSCKPVAPIQRGHSEAPNSSVLPGPTGLLGSRPGLCVLSSPHPWCPSTHPRLRVCPCSLPPPSLLLPSPDRPSRPPCAWQTPPQPSDSHPSRPHPCPSAPAPRLWLPTAHSMHSSCAHNFHLHAWCPSLAVSSPGRGLASPLWEVRAQVGMQAHGLGDSELLGAKSGPWGLIPALPPAGPQSPHL